LISGKTAILRGQKMPEHSGTNFPTMVDVARLAGVSTATVSRYLSSPEAVKTKTRDKVALAIDSLGYTPNFGARAMAAKRTQTIGAIIPTMENAIFARGIQAFQEELIRHGYTLLVASSSYRQDIEEEQIRMLVARGADALLLIGYDRSQKTYQFLKERGVPILVAWVYQQDTPQLSIGFDNREAMAGLTREVLRLGHTRIGCISAFTDNNDRARERVVGISDALKEFGLLPENLTVVQTTYSVESGERALEQLMSKSEKPTVIMCGNDVLAVGALRKAKAMGFSVPRELSITGFDDIELATLTEPQITTVHVPHRKMGRLAARMIVDRLQGKPRRPSLKLKTDIRMRGTLAQAQKTSSAIGSG